MMNATDVVGPIPDDEHEERDYAIIDFILEIECNRKLEVCL